MENCFEDLTSDKMSDTVLRNFKQILLFHSYSFLSVRFCLHLFV